MDPIIAMTFPSREDGQAKANMEYPRAVLQSGGVPVMVPPCTDPEKLSAIMEKADGLILTGGCDVEPAKYGQKTESWCGRIDLERDAEEYALLDCAMRLGKPVLGICRGHQVINCYFGGTLYQDIAQETGGSLKHDEFKRRAEDVHPVSVEEGTVLSTIIPKTIYVNSRHHQGINVPAKGFIPSAYAPDGLIEGIEMKDGPVFGVQWHPESLFAEKDHARKLFAFFVGLCADKQK